MVEKAAPACSQAVEQALQVQRRRLRLGEAVGGRRQVVWGSVERGHRFADPGHQGAQRGAVLMRHQGGDAAADHREAQARQPERNDFIDHLLQRVLDPEPAVPGLQPERRFDDGVEAVAPDLPGDGRDIDGNAGKLAPGPVFALLGAPTGPGGPEPRKRIGALRQPVDRVFFKLAGHFDLPSPFVCESCFAESVVVRCDESYIRANAIHFAGSPAVCLPENRTISSRAVPGFLVRPLPLNWCLCSTLDNR